MNSKSHKHKLCKLPHPLDGRAIPICDKPTTILDPKDNICIRIAEKFLDKFEKLDERERDVYGDLLIYLVKPVIFNDKGVPK